MNAAHLPTLNRGSITGAFVSCLSAKLLMILFALQSPACQKSETEGQAPPIKVPAPIEPCAGAKPTLVAGLPGLIHGFCVDLSSDVRRYGVGAPSPLGDVCVELFNGECELYKSYGLEGVSTLHYIAAKGTSAQVNIVVSSFRRSSGAFGFYTRRILGEGSPSEVTMQPLEVSGRAASGIGMFVLWRGKEVIEATYLHEMATPKEIEAEGRLVLPSLAVALSEALVGATEPERIVRLLETPKLDSLGISVRMDGLLKVVGSGPGAIGHYTKVEFPHRLLIAERRDEYGSKDLLRLLRNSGLSKKLKGRDIVRLRHVEIGRPPETWFMRRQGSLLLAIGPAQRGQDASLSTPKERKAYESKWKNFAVPQLMKFSTRELKFGE